MCQHPSQVGFHTGFENFPNFESRRGQGGQPYILHPLRLVMRVKTETEKIVAVQHEVVEDSQPPHRWGFDELAARGLFRARAGGAGRCDATRGRDLRGFHPPFAEDAARLMQFIRRGNQRHRVRSALGEPND